MANHFSEYDAFNLPPEFRPLGAWAYFGLAILFNIPVIGLIFLIVFSLSDANINRRNYARAYFCALVVCAVLFAILFFTGLLNEFVQTAADGKLIEYFSFLPWVKA